MLKVLPNWKRIILEHGPGEGLVGHVVLEEHNFSLGANITDRPQGADVVALKVDTMVGFSPVPISNAPEDTWS